MRTNHFTDRESGIVVRVEKVTDQFASITVVQRLISTWSMPTAMYDSEFVTRYKPMDIGEVRVPEEFRMPANAQVWVDEGLLKVDDVVATAVTPPAPTTVEPDEDESDDGVDSIETVVAPANL